VHCIRWAMVSKAMHNMFEASICNCCAELVAWSSRGKLATKVSNSRAAAYRLS
jgi:hypothetical protein